MSNSSGPSTCRRSARSKNVFESSESFCSGPNDNKNILSSSGQLRCPADSSSLADNSPDKVKRKKRRKSPSELELDNCYRVNKRRAVESNKSKLPYEELIRVKLKDSRIPIILLNRLDNDHSQPKLEVEKKDEQRVQLPRLTLSSKVDPKILKFDVVVKINKRQTESLIEVSKRRLQRQPSISTNDTDDRRQGESAELVLDSDSNKCAERLTTKLESFLSKDNKCSKNQLVRNNSRRHARASVDKSNNNRLPKRLYEANSRFSLSSITENGVSENHPESSKSSKSFIHNNRRFKRYSLDNVNEKNNANLLESKPKCIENVAGESGQKHSEVCSKDVKKYFKNSTKVVRKYSGNITDVSDQKYLVPFVDNDEKCTLPSLSENAEKQNKITCRKNRRVSTHTLQRSRRCTRNIINKNNRHVNDSIQMDSCKIFSEPNNDKFSENSDKDFKNTFKSQIENQKMITGNVAINSDTISENATEISKSDTEKFVEVHNKRLSKRLDKFNDYIHNETENNKRITRRHDDKNYERRSDNIENRVNFIENFVEESKNISENVAAYSKKQTDPIKRSTRSMSDKNDKNIENTQDNNLDHSQNFKESIKIKSQNICTNIEKCSDNIKENNKRLSRNTEKSLQLVEEITESHSKKCEDTIKKISDKFISDCVDEKNDLPKNFTESVEQVSEKTFEYYAKNFHDKFTKILKIPIEATKLLRKNLASIGIDKSEATSTNHFDTIQKSVIEQNNTKHPDTNKEINADTKNNIEKNKRPRRKLFGKSNDNNTPLNTEDCIEKSNERLTENLNKNISERSKTQVEIITKRTRFSDKKTNPLENSEHHKLDEHSNNKNNEKVCEQINTSLKENSTTQSETINKIIRKKSFNKNEKISENLINNELDSIQSFVEINEDQITEKLPMNCVKDCLRIEKDNKMITRNSSYYKQDKHEKVHESNMYFVQDFVEEKDKSSKEQNKNLKHFCKTSKEDFKLVTTNLSSNGNITNHGNSSKSKLNFLVILSEDNKKEFPKKSDKHFKDNLQNENKIITRRSSHYGYEKRIFNSTESSNLIHNTIQETSKEQPKELVNNLTENVINSIEEPKKLHEKIEKQSENMINSNLNSLPNSVVEEKRNLFETSEKSVKTNIKIQAENSIVTRNSLIHKNEKLVENLIKIKTNYEGNDSKSNEKKFHEETHKHIKDYPKFQSEHKMTTRNLSSIKCEDQINNFINNKSNPVENDLNKNEEKVPEKLKKSIIENKVVKNLSSCKISNKLIRDKSICTQNGIFNIEKSAEELYKNIKECSVSEVEDCKTALRNSSDNNTVNFIENKSDCIHSTIERNQKNSVEELDKVIKDCSKSQIENNKRVTRKSSSDKHERHIEDLVISHSISTQNCLEKNKEKFIDKQEKKSENLNTSNANSSQNCIDKNNEIISEQVNNKENSKIKIEINTRMTRSLSLRKEIPLMGNTIDHTQTLTTENKSSENLIDNKKDLFNNLSDGENVIKKSDKINNVHVQKNIFKINENKSSSHLIDEINEKQSCSDQSCMNQEKDFIENSIITKEKLEDLMECNSEKTEHILNSTDQKFTSISERNNKTRGKIHLNTSFNNVSVNVTNNSNFIENEVPISSEIKDQFINFKDDFTKITESLTNFKIKETLIQDNRILNNMNDLIENGDTCIKTSVDADIEKKTNIVVEICSKNINENNIKKLKNSVSVKCQNLSEQKINEDILTRTNNEPVFNQLKEKSSKIIISEIPFQEKKNQCKNFFKVFPSSSENITLEICNNHSSTFDEITKFTEKSNDINKTIECQGGNSNEMVNNSLVINNTKAQEDSVEDVTEILAEDLDESIRNSSRILTENSTMTTSLSFGKNDEIFVENLNNDYNTSSAENLVDKVYTNESQNFKNCMKNNLTSSIENNSYGNSAVNDKTDEVLFENVLQSNVKLDEKITKQNINIIENSNSTIIVDNSVRKSENVIHKNIKTMVQNADLNSENSSTFMFISNQNQSVIDEEAIAKERRKITLIELKKKCTENLGNRQVVNVEFSRQEALKTLPVVTMNENIKDTLKDCIKNSMVCTLDNMVQRSESEENCSESMFESFDSEENLSDKLMQLKSLEYLNQNIDSKFHKEDQYQVKNIELKYNQSSILDQNIDFNCKNCDENFDSNHESKRYDKVKHRQRLVLKITKTNANKHVTHMVEPVLKQKDDGFDQVNNVNTIEKNCLPVTAGIEQKTKSTEQKQNYQITEGDIKIIVKKEGGSKNSHIVKEIKITPKSGDYGSNSSDGSNFTPSSSSPTLSETGQPIKRQRGRPRKYPIFTGAKLLETQLSTAANLNSVVKTSESKPFTDNSLFHSIESTISKPDNFIENNKNIIIDNKTTENVKWTESEDSKWAKMIGVKRKRKQLFSLDFDNETNDNISPAEKRHRPDEDGNKEEMQRNAETEFCTKYKITKELVVKLTKLDSVPNINKEFNVNINNFWWNDDDDNSTTKADEKSRTKMRPSSNSLEDECSRESTKTVKNLSLENNNNNVNDIEKCLTTSDNSNKIKSRNGGPEAGSSKTSTEIWQASSSTEETQEYQRTTKQRSDTNAPEMKTKTQLVVTPRRQTIDRAEADESQKAKLLMLMNATTPYEAANKMNTTVVESPQALQTQCSTMQLQPQQFCILFIPDALYTSESTNKDITPTATIVNFQPVPDAEMPNRSLIYTPTTPTKISIDEHAKSYVCGTCTEVLDMIGRLEASLGMTEEDKSAIKCPYCSNHFQSLFYLEYHIMQEHLKCENEKQCKHSHFNSLRIPSHEATSEFEIYITFALKCRSCYDIFSTVLQLNDHVMHKHKTLVRLRPSLGPAAIEAVCSAYPSFSRKNGVRNSAVPTFQCPSDCVCRIGIRSSDTPQQRQQMLKRCPHVMRRLEKIESAAYEVYTCTLCKSTFLMKDEVVDHLMKMHEVSCKFPCYTCLTSFRSLQMQENHRCSETTLQDLDKILSIAILPTNVGGKDNNKYLEREDSSTDEYGAIKTPGNNELQFTPPSPHRNGFKRKHNGTCMSTPEKLLSTSKPKNAKLTNEKVRHVKKRSKKACPKCKKRFVYRKSLHDHIIYEHILKGNGQDGPKKIAVELLKLVNDGKANGARAQELARLLAGHTDDDGTPLKDLTMMDEQENWEDVSTTGNESTNEKDLIKCTRCKIRFKSQTNSGNLSGLNRQQYLPTSKRKFGLCENCESIGPKTRRHQLQIIHPFVCKKCPNTFPTSIELKCHKRAMHSKNAEDTFHTCDICKKIFPLIHMLEKHKKTDCTSTIDTSTKHDEEEDEEDTTHNSDSAHNCSKDSEANHSLDSKVSTSVRRDSSDSSSAGSKEAEEQPFNCTFCEEVCSSKVSLKNHLKREHGRRASICQFCNGLLIDTSEVRHMLDYHIVPSKLNPRLVGTEPKISLGGPWSRDEAGRMRDDVEELVRILGKHRLQSLMMYHDFEGKCNNAIMRCPICPELFATRESCRFHYVWIHDDNCLLCDETFRSGSSACQHKVTAHTSTASYLWCIQRLVTAIVSTLRLDPNQPSHVLYQILANKLEEGERAADELESVVARCPSEKGSTEETTSVTERFLEEVLSEDQLPDSSNIIEVVIGKEDSEDDLLSMLNLSPNYEICEQHRLPNAGVVPPEEDDDEETIAAGTAVPTTPPMLNAMTMGTNVAMTTSPVVDSYVTSGVCKYKLENDEEQLVLVVTDDDLVTFKDDIGSLAERISTTCDSLTLEEITEMLRAYFENMSVNVSGSGSA